MNAYELADWLEQVEHELREKSQFKLSRASDMLRQQADRIAELEKDVVRYRWLRREFAAGRETYIGENMLMGDESATDEYIDEQMLKEKK